jgi:hypothetical protein
MKFKKILLDLDGTVIDKQGHISLPVINKIKQINETIPISFCTGRFADFVSKTAADLNISNNHIVEDGSRVIDANGNTLWCKLVPDELVTKVVSLGRQYGFNVAGNVGGLTKDCLDGTEINLTQIFPWGLNINQIDVVFSTIQYPEIRVMKVWHDPIKGDNISITHKDGTKKNGIKFLLNHEGLSTEEIACVGDGVNDLSLFEASGFRVAMGNAEKELKDKADLVVTPVEEDGLVFALDKILST